MFLTYFSLIIACCISVCNNLWPTTCPWIFFSWTCTLYGLTKWSNNSWGSPVCPVQICPFCAFTKPVSTHKEQLWLRLARFSRQNACVKFFRYRCDLGGSCSVDRVQGLSDSGTFSMWLENRSAFSLSMLLSQMWPKGWIVFQPILIDICVEIVLPCLGGHKHSRGIELFWCNGLKTIKLSCSTINLSEFANRVLFCVWKPDSS